MDQLIKLLKEKYNVHCVFLYGSRTTSTFFQDSDYDVLAIRTSGSRVREIIQFNDLTVDLIVDTEELINFPENYLYLWSHQLLLDEQAFGKKMVDAHLKYLSQPADKLPSNRVAQRKKQIHDELKYIAHDNVIGNFRRHDLLSKILPLYFNLIGEWYLGDKHALNWLQNNKSEFYKLFVTAIRPQASINDIKLLVDAVCDES